MIPLSAPITYFWAAEYENDLIFPQFDLETGKENLFSEIEQDRLKSFGWYPIGFDLSLKIRQSNVDSFVEANESTAYVKIHLDKYKKLFACRRQKLSYSVGQIDNRDVIYVVGYEGGPYLFLKSNGCIEVSYDKNMI